MILVDMSNLSIKAIQSICYKKAIEIDGALVRHAILKELYKIHKMIGVQHELVLCFDNKNYWKKELFPYYKKNRVKSEDFDWENYFKFYNEFKTELPDYFNFKCVEVDRCEADCIIGTLTIHHRGEDIIIVSSDKDFLQLQQLFPNVRQYSIQRAMYITLDTNDYDLFDHIICGDKGDGIPNILSDEDTFMQVGKRQKTMTAKRLDELKYDHIDYIDRYTLNRTLIDLRMIPEEYKLSIINKFNERVERISTPYKYCLKHKLNQLLKEIM